MRFAARGSVSYHFRQVWLLVAFFLLWRRYGHGAIVFWSVSSSCSDRILCAARDFFKEVRLCADVLSGIDSLISDVFLFVLWLCFAWRCHCAALPISVLEFRERPLSSCRLRFFVVCRTNVILVLVEFRIFCTARQLALTFRRNATNRRAILDAWSRLGVLFVAMDLTFFGVLKFFCSCAWTWL